MKTFLELLEEDKKNIEYRYEVSDNLRKLSRVQKHMIDATQLLNEMTDDIRKLKRNSILSDDAVEAVDEITKQIDGILFQLRDATYKGKEIHVEFRLAEIEKNYIELKKIKTKKEDKKEPEKKKKLKLK